MVSATAAENIQDVAADRYIAMIQDLPPNYMNNKDLKEFLDMLFPGEQVVRFVCMYVCMCVCVFFFFCFCFCFYFIFFFKEKHGCMCVYYMCGYVCVCRVTVLPQLDEINKIAKNINRKKKHLRKLQRARDSGNSSYVPPVLPVQIRAMFQPSQSISHTLPIDSPLYPSKKTKKINDKQLPTVTTTTTEAELSSSPKRTTNHNNDESSDNKENNDADYRNIEGNNDNNNNNNDNNHSIPANNARTQSQMSDDFRTDLRIHASKKKMKQTCFRNHFCG